MPGLGTAQDTESLTSRELAPGVRYSRIDKGADAPPVVWIISFGVSRAPGEGAVLESCAQAIGLDPKPLEFAWPGSGTLRYTEWTAGAFHSRDAAVDYMATHPQPEACAGRITATPLYPDQSAGPWRVHVVEVEPGVFAGSLRTARSNGRAIGRVKTSAIADQFGALVATNGGYFVMEREDGSIGESAGLSVVSGVMQSEPSRNRPWFLFPHADQAKAQLETSLDQVAPVLIWGDGSISPLDGIDRYPDLLRNCGTLSEGADQIAWHDRTCHPDDQLVAIRQGDGFNPSDFTRENNADQVIIHLTAQGVVEPLGTRALAPGDYALIATGARRQEILDRMAQGAKARIAFPLTDHLPEASAVSGGPTLIDRGKLVFDEQREGWPFALAAGKAANDMHRFVVLRAPRTAIGVRKDGTVLLVVVDGWRYADDRVSAVPLNGGASIDELRRIMLDLGADQAMNLDGGGSSTLVIEGNVVNQPSDASGERAVGDAVLLIP